MIVSINYMDDSATDLIVKMNVLDNITVGELKHLINTNLDVDIQAQELSFVPPKRRKAIELNENDKTLKSYGIKDRSEIELTIIETREFKWEQEDHYDEDGNFSFSDYVKVFTE